jgi:Spy/CpxP family protein refolding chaperone
MFYWRTKLEEAKMKKYLLIVVVILILSAFLLINAQPDFRGLTSGRDQQGWGLFASQNFIPARLLLQAKEKIGLSVDQEKKLTAMIDTHEQWVIKFGADMKIKALKLRTILAAEQLNLKDAEQLIREQADMHAEMQIARLHFQQDIKALLTPEQLLKISELKKEFRAQGYDGGRQRSERHWGRRN